MVLTGAGISAESGIATFRDAGGLWENHRIEEVASPEAFEASPETVWRFYGQRRAQALTVAPNPAHHALADLEERLGEHFLLVTQNVDHLHEAAGSRHVIHMHGELFKSRCSSCGAAPFDDRRHDFTSGLPRCGACGALERPHIVWFGEVPFALSEIQRRVEECDVFLTVGSSGVVYPAAGLVRTIGHRRSRGESCRAIYVGLERPDNADAFDRVVLGRAGEVLPDLLGVGATGSSR
ncbi:MAG TPA: NAD-dependent deacylase [Vulgatibacter sp.]